MISSINNGGLTHIKYEHKHFPRVVELECKKCCNKIIAHNSKVPKNVAHFINDSDIYNNWNLYCQYCTYRKSLSWTEMKSFNLWIRAEIKGIQFWAWNINHFNMIIKKFRDERLSYDNWQLFEAYIPKKWLLKLKNNRDITRLENLIKEKNIL